MSEPMIPQARISRKELEEKYKQLEVKYDKLQAEFEEYKDGAVKWSVEDFTDYEGYKISKENAELALADMIHNHDCTIGITWETVQHYLDQYGMKIADPVTFQGKEFTIREVYLPNNGVLGSFVNVAPIELETLLYDADNEFVSEEAEEIDEEIYFYANPDQFELPEEELVKIIKANE